MKAELTVKFIFTEDKASAKFASSKNLEEFKKQVLADTGDIKLFERLIKDLSQRLNIAVAEMAEGYSAGIVNKNSRS